MVTIKNIAVRLALFFLVFVALFAPHECKKCEKILRHNGFCMLQACDYWCKIEHRDQSARGYCITKPRRNCMCSFPCPY
ncbi:hypothetical protein I3760_01G026800 [Carya illinoinensis]|uniref:Uncharacterized protein n=1 Tax=Carya illinoinensis TaxID=32201 RepID=A0A8T1RID1_CARIL|nr:hypothetical protein I3760_01G026800 [Carya illinoinensis]KAG6666389.1 hypothetical protein CIPAW_01G028500 [Carya illinoinensis]KAG6729429.1 hypothetical protein I3842_01G029300 [Carya illinoinensis]